MNIWLIKEGEGLPVDGENTRLLRIGILAGMLAERGHHVTWWTSTFYHQEKRFRFERDTVVNINENYVIRLLHANPYKTNISLARFRNNRKIAKRFFVEAQTQSKPDVLLVCMPTIDFTFQAVRYAKKYNVKAIVDIRDFWPDIFIDYFPKALAPLVKLASSGMDRHLCDALSNADAIVSMADYGVELGVKKASRERRTADRVFYLGSPDRLGTESVNTGIWLTQGITSDKFIVVFFGMVAHSANLEHVVEAAKQITEADIQFVICGDGDMLERLKQQAAGLDNIFFPGRVGASEIAGLAQIAKAGIMSYRKFFSYSNGFSNKFIEYLCFKLPALVYTDGTMREFAKKSNCGLSYDTPEELADRVVFLKNNPHIQEEMARNARFAYLENFEARKVYGGMIDYLEEMACIDK